MTTDIIGSSISHYRVVARLGAGGMGEVYRATDERLGRDVALKILPTSFAKDADRLRRFEQEARAAGSLNHPNVLTVFDLGEQDGAPFLVAELLEGQTLRERLAESSLPPRKALDYAAQVASGLAAAHERGIAHRDLKPDNLFITKDGRVKILDFGLAKLAPAATAPDSEATLAAQAAPMTNAGVVLGTVGYMSPEQVRGKPADHRSDIFSLGAILYEMVSGQRAFHGESSVETMNAILKEDPPEISVSGQHIAPSLDRLVRRCVEKSPEERFQSARDLGFALEAVSGTSSSGVAAQAAVAEQKSSKRWLAVAAIGAVLVIAAAAYWAGAQRGSPESRPEFRMLSFRPQVIYRAAFSPDGREVVYSAALQGNVPELFVVRKESPAPQALGMRNVHLLAVSSKGELAVLVKARYLHHSFFGGTLATMPLVGGAPRERLENVTEAAWTPDGSELAILRDVDGKFRLEFPAGKVLYETSGWLSRPVFSPDGTRIAFFDHAIRFDDRGSLAVVDMKGQKTTLSEGYGSTSGVAWSGDGREVYFSGAGDGMESVYAVTMDGRRRLALEIPGDMSLHDIAADGRWLITADDARKDVYGLLPGEKADRDLSWLDFSSGAVMSDDAQVVVFTEENSYLGGNYTVCARKAPGYEVTVLGEGFIHDLTADGKWAMAIVPSSPPRVALYPTGAGQAKTLERGPLESYQSAKWFPDQKRVLLCANEPGRATRCYVQEVSGGAPKAVTPEGTSTGYVSPDGQRALVRDAGGNHLLYPVGGGAAQAVTAIANDERLVRWSPDGRSVFVYRSAEVPTRIERVELATGRRELFKTLTPVDAAGVLAFQHVTVSRDGKAYAYQYRRELMTLYAVTGAK